MDPGLKRLLEEVDGFCAACGSGVGSLSEDGVGPGDDAGQVALVNNRCVQCGTWAEPHVEPRETFASLAQKAGQPVGFMLINGRLVLPKGSKLRP